MPARLSLTKAERDALLVLPDTEEAFVRHYSLSGEDGEIIGRYRKPETRLVPGPDLLRAMREGRHPKPVTVGDLSIAGNDSTQLRDYSIAHRLGRGGNEARR
jgi:hypothetical protein